MRILKTFLILICLTIFTIACEREEQPPKATPQQQSAVEKVAPVTAEAPVSDKQPVTFMEQGLSIQRGETIADALPVWRQFRKRKPTLLLIANNPALVPPPPQLQAQITDAMASATADELQIAGNPKLSNPLFLPGMTIDLALRHNWLSQLVWAIPIKEPEKELSLEKFRKQMLDRGMATTEETESIELADAIYNGTLRGLPFLAGALQNLPVSEGPFIIHFDLSYFQQLYKNEVTTPAMPMVVNVLQMLKERKLPVLAATFSYNHEEGNIPLDVRFLGDFLEYLTEKPDRLDQPVPPAWKAQNDILYLDNFFQKDKIEELHLIQAKEAPDLPWVRFNLYKLANRNGDLETAFNYLDGAARIDPAYAIEFIRMAHLDNEGIPAEHKLAMIERASAALSDDVILKLQQAELALDAGKKELAETTLKGLKGQTWSPIYYRGMMEYLDSLSNKLN